MPRRLKPRLLSNLLRPAGSRALPRWCKRRTEACGFHGGASVELNPAASTVVHHLPLERDNALITRLTSALSKPRPHPRHDIRSTSARPEAHVSRRYVCTAVEAHGFQPCE